MQKKIKKLLDTPFCIETLETMTCYQRVQDDCDGDMGQRLNLIVGPDGDMHISIIGDSRSLRFRNYFGGGMIRGPYSHEPARLEVILLGMQGLGKPGVNMGNLQWGSPVDLNFYFPGYADGAMSGEESRSPSSKR